MVVGQRIGDHHRNCVRFLAGGAAGTPDAEDLVSSSLFGAEEFVEDAFVEQIELRLVAEKAGLIDGQVFQQTGQFLFAFLADQQAIVTVERIHLALFEAALQAVLQEVGTAFVEMHAAFLVHERLQKLELGFGQLGGDAWCAHDCLSCPLFCSGSALSLTLFSNFCD